MVTPVAATIATQTGIAPGEDQRDDDLDDHGQREGEGDQRANAAPAADDRDGDREEDEQEREGRDPVQVGDGDERRVGIGRGVDDDLVADLVARQVLRARRTLEEAVDGLALERPVEHDDADVRIGRVAAGRAGTRRSGRGSSSTGSGWVGAGSGRGRGTRSRAAGRAPRRARRRCGAGPRTGCPSGSFGSADPRRIDASRGGVRRTLGRLGPLLQDAQMRLDPAGQRGPAEADEDAGPAIERLERGGVDDPRAAGDRLQPPAPLAVEAGRRDPDPEARIRAAPRGSRPARRRAAARAAPARSGSSRRPARAARPARGGAPGRAPSWPPDRGASPRPCVAWRGRRRAARPSPSSEARPVRSPCRASAAGAHRHRQPPIGCQTVFISRKAAIHSGRSAAASSSQSKRASATLVGRRDRRLMSSAASSSISVRSSSGTPHVSSASTSAWRGEDRHELRRDTRSGR